MMRVTVKGVLLGGSVGVLITTALLWTQCRPPLGRANFVNGDPAVEGAQEHQNQQKRRHPLMAKHQSNGASPDADDYTDALVNYPAVRSPQLAEDAPFTSLDEEDQFEKDDTFPMSEISCLVNQETSISCRRDETDVFIPFSFLHSYFEVYGRVLVNDQGQDFFEWSHSYSNVYLPKEPYSHIGKFLNFQMFNVEARERVKCISATEGVPISTQWQSSGYTYPIQIAQYGLSHYSKFLEEPPPKKLILEDGSKRQAKFKYNSETESINRVFHRGINSHVLKFSTVGSTERKGILLKITDSLPPDLLVLNMYMQLAADVNSSITVTLQTHEKRSDLFYIHYICSNKLIETKDQHIYYGLGMNSSWRYLTRNLMVDLLKGIAASSHAKKLKKRVNKSKVRVVTIEFIGKGQLSNISLATSDHIRHFYAAADWLLKHQDEHGGWSIPVARKVISGVLEVDPGWYSAMAQGQAISLLVRAAHFSGNQKYLQSATKATKLFSVNVTKGGVRTYFPGGFVWYEEYPTSPSLFVLNGFIYSLLGLYDLKQSAAAPPNPSAALFEDGMKSLRTLLPLYDTGQGSFYDLRHFTSHIAPNIARWDYHTTHITQLLTLANMDKEGATFFSATAARWKEYLVGKRAKHN